MTLLAFPTLGGPELLIVGVVAVLIFGKRIPEVMRSLGKGVVEFKKGISGVEDEPLEAPASAEKKKPAATTPEV